MPPRKRGSAKKSVTPRSKQEPTTTTTTEVAEQEQQQQEEASIVVTNGEEQQQEASIAVTNGEEQQVVVEESTFTQEITTEESTVEVKVVEQEDAAMDESKDVQEDVKEEKNVEEAMDVTEEAKEGEEEDPEEEEEEEQEEEEAEEEDGTQDAVEGEKIADDVAVGGGDANNAVDNGSADSEGEENESDTDDEDDEEGVDLSAYMMQDPLKDKKKVTDVEIFVGGLNRKAVEDDLIEVFKEFGEIKEVRIVKHPVTKRSKGYAFVTFATSEQAKKVLAELKDGIEVKGKRAGVSPSQDSDTLYMGNICKTWNKEQVVESLKGFGIEQFEEIYLPEDPKAEGQIRGFAYLEFDTHSTAMAAFQRLRKPDAVFGRNRSAKVAFAPSMHPSEEALAEVKTIFVEGLPDSWDEDKLKKLCEQYGQIEKVQLSRDLATVKRKDFGFVTFTLRENALACVTAINNAEIGEGDVKVKANLAKPKYKGKLGKKAARGGYRVQKDGEKTKESGKSKASGDSKPKGGDKGKGKVTPKSKNSKGAKQPQGKAAERQVASAEKSQPAKGRKRDGKSLNSAPSGRPSKKPRGGSGRPITGSGSRGRYSHPGNRRPGQTYARVPADPYVRGYTTSGPSYQSPYDMAPHAGYYRNAPTSRQDLYDQRPIRGGGYYTPGRRATSYVGGSAPPPPYSSGYPPYSAYESQSSGAYAYPSSGAYLNRRPYY